MEPADDGLPHKDFGPQSSLRRRRMWGGLCVAAVFAFLGAVIAVSGDGSRCEACTTFGANDTNETLPAWLLAAGVVAVVAVSLTAPLLGKTRNRSEGGGTET